MDVPRDTDALMCLSTLFHSAATAAGNEREPYRHYFAAGATSGQSFLNLRGGVNWCVLLDEVCEVPMCQAVKCLVRHANDIEMNPLRDVDQVQLIEQWADVLRTWRLYLLDTMLIGGIRPNSYAHLIACSMANCFASIYCSFITSY